VLEGIDNDERAVGEKMISLHPMDVTLEHVHKTTTVMLAPCFATAELDTGGRLEIIGSGSTVRFTITGIEGHVDLNIAQIAARATAILRAS
jgi:hypothetical protein